MKLYYSRGACSLVARIVFNELKLPVAYEAVDLRTKRTAAGKDYLLLTPKGAVPVLEMDNGELLTENVVILQYIIDKEKAVHLLPAFGEARYRILEWLNYIATELQKNLVALFYQTSDLEEARDQIFIPLIRSRMNYVNDQLQEKDYLYGESFTVADAYLFVMLSWFHRCGLNIHEWENLSFYFKMLSERPSIVESFEQENLILR